MIKKKQRAMHTSKASESKMAAFRKLDPEDRDFFSLVRKATFANPFSDERVQIDLSISGLPAETPAPDRVAAITREVHGRIARLESRGRIGLDDFEKRDRQLMENVFLFDFFHQYLDRFDRLIPEQIEAGDRPVPVPFAAEALRLLRQRGFDPDGAARYFSLCFQLRRAYYFIDHRLVGSSPSMKRLRRNLWNNVFTHDIGLYDQYLWNRMEDFSTLLLGETGTGKGTAAAAIGQSGFIPFDAKKGSFAESFVKTFITLNLSQFPETLIESELFGHKKGAFTGATEDYKGIFHRCSPCGSIFLDEIGEVSVPVQIKLLRVLQERTFSPVGSHEGCRFEGRVIGATNRPLTHIRQKGIFRDDFFYRLCSDIITVPPLRQRIGENERELDDLIAHTVCRIVGSPSTELSEMVRNVIDTRLGKGYPWPGNVRELEQCVRRVLLRRDYQGDLRAADQDIAAHLAEGIEKGEMEAQAVLTGYCALLYERHGTYEAAAKAAGLDRRTVKKYILQWQALSDGKGEEGN